MTVLKKAAIAIATAAGAMSTARNVDDAYDGKDVSPVKATVGVALCMLPLFLNDKRDMFVLHDDVAYLDT